MTLSKTFILLLLYYFTGHVVVDPEPEFLAPLENHTVSQGRDVYFTCVVNHLGQYKVLGAGRPATSVKGRFLLTTSVFYDNDPKNCRILRMIAADRASSVAERQIRLEIHHFFIDNWRSNLD